MRLTDKFAKALWSGEVEDTDTHYRVGNMTEVSKQGDRRGKVPSHVTTPFEGKPRPFNPFGLRRLADTETVQAAIDTIVAEVKTIDWSNSPDEERFAGSPVLEEITRGMEDLNPNKESKEDVEEIWIRDLLEVGNAVAAKNFNLDGRRVEVNPLDPNTFTVDWDSNRILQGFWQYDLASQGYLGRPDAFDREEVIWLTLGKESSRAGFYGHSPTEKLQRVINVLGGLLDKEINELEEGMPPGIVSLIGDWSDKDYKRFETYWEENVKGEQHKVPLAKGDAKFEPFTMSYQELQILDRQQWYAKLVGAIFKTPISETGLAIGEEMTRATDVSQRQKFKQKGIRPMLEILEAAWTKQYIHPHFTEQVSHQFEPGLDLMEKRELANIHQTWLQQGVMTINEVREELGKEPVPWGDEPFDLRTHARAESGLSSSGRSFLPGGDGPDGGDPGGQSQEMDNQDALDEGLQPDPGQEESESDFRKGAGLPGGQSLLPQSGCIHKAEQPLRETDDWQEFHFHPAEIEQFRQDISAVIGDYVGAVLDRVRSNRDKWTTQADGDMTVEKALPDFFQYVTEEIGIELAEDLSSVITSHKSEKILEGEEEILDELAAASVSREAIEQAVDLSRVQDRVVDRIQNRTMKITKPVSDRLEQELRDVISDGWNNGKSITDIERDIEDLTDQWQGTDAERLARDQLGKASKEGRLEYARETSELVGGWHKSWIATLDNRVRDSHKYMNEETVPQEEPWVVDYSPEGGPSSVEEMYPGESYWGIQCRCDYALMAAPEVQKFKEWAESRDTDRMQEISKDLGSPVWQRLLSLEVQVQEDRTSRTQAAKALGVSKRTYYEWLKDVGAYEEPVSYVMV